MILHHNKELLEEAIRAAALKLSLPVEYVEKDYWVTYALKNLANSNLANDIVFKGGTSLSKAYGLISRFSCSAQKLYAKTLLGYSNKEITKAVQEGALIEVENNG